jgi:hypothetical protein
LNPIHFEGRGRKSPSIFVAAGSNQDHANGESSAVPRRRTTLRTVRRVPSPRPLPMATPGGGLKIAVDRQSGEPLPTIRTRCDLSLPPTTLVFAFGGPRSGRFRCERRPPRPKRAVHSSKRCPPASPASLMARSVRATGSLGHPEHSHTAPLAGQSSAPPLDSKADHLRTWLGLNSSPMCIGHVRKSRGIHWPLIRRTRRLSLGHHPPETERSCYACCSQTTIRTRTVGRRACRPARRARRRADKSLPRCREALR